MRKEMTCNGKKIYGCSISWYPTQKPYNLVNLVDQQDYLNNKDLT